MKVVKWFIIIFAAVLVLALIAEFVYKGLTKDYYICEYCKEKHYPKLEGKGVQIEDIWLNLRCFSILNLKAGRVLGLGNLKDGDSYEVRNVERKRWVYEQAKRGKL